MAQINQSQLKDNIVKSARIETSADVVPNQTQNFVMPVIDVNPYPNRYVTITRADVSSASGSTTLFTTPTTADFFLTSASLSLSKTAASDNVDTFISYEDEDGAARKIISFTTNTLTAFSDNISRDFSIPIKIRRGSNIIMTGTQTAGALVKRGSITGFTI